MQKAEVKDAAEPPALDCVLLNEGNRVVLTRTEQTELHRRTSVDLF